MSENWALNGFYDMSKTTPLYEAISRRESCRSFASAPTAQQWTELEAAAESLALPGTRMALGLCDNSLFQPFGGLLMKFENVRRFAAIITKAATPENAVNAGLSGEMLMLKAVSLALGGCWVAGTYKHSKVGVQLQEGEKIRALLALGIPQGEGQEIRERKRKPLSQLCSDNFQDAPSSLRDVASAVRNAPSAMNLQPWRMDFTPPDGLTLAVPRAAQRLDLGIALSHALLALGSTRASFALAEDGLSARITL